MDEWMSVSERASISMVQATRAAASLSDDENGETRKHAHFNAIIMRVIVTV